MGFLDTVKTPETTSIGGNAPAKTGFLATVSTPAAGTNSFQPAAAPDFNTIDAANESQQTGVTGLFKQAVSGIWNTVKSVGSGIVSSYTKPDAYEQSIEQSAPPILRQIDAPLLRTFAPLTEGLNKDIASAIVLNNPSLYDSFTKAVTSNLNKTPAEQDADAAIENAPQKTPLQVVGDVSQGVFSLLAPDLFGEKLGSGILPALTRNAQIGFTFGLSQVASSGETDPDAIAQTLLQSTIAGAVTGLVSEAALHGVSSATDAAGAARTLSNPSVIDAIKTMQDKVNTVLAPEAPAVEVPAEVTAQRTQTHAEYAQSQGYEPYTANKDLPTISFGKEAKSSIPSIDADEAPNVPKTYDQLAPEDKQAVLTETRKLFGKGMDYQTAQDTAVARFNEAQNAPKGETTVVPLDDENPALKPIAKDAVEAPSVEKFVAKAEKEITPKQAEAVKTRTSSKTTEEGLAKFYQATNKFSDSEKTVSGLAKSVETDAVKAGIKLDTEKLPQYGIMNMEHQAEMAKALIEKDPEYAMKVAKGEVPPPNNDLLANSVYSAFRVLADKSSDIEAKTEIYRQLAEHSNTTEQARAAGQAIKALDTGLDHADPVSVIQDIRDAREKAIEDNKKGTLDKQKKEIAQDIKSEIKKSVSKKQSWDDFIKDIQCKF